MHVEIAYQYTSQYPSTITVDATDDGSTVTARVHLVRGSCDFIDDAPVIERVRE